MLMVAAQQLIDVIRSRHCHATKWAEERTNHQLHSPDTHKSWAHVPYIPLCGTALNYLCRTERNVQLLMAAAMGAHTVEAVYTIRLCWNAGLSHEQLM